MRKLGFWNSDGEQFRAINEAADEIAELHATNNFMHQQADSLHRQVHAQRAEIAKLRAALQAVCDLLVDLDVIEEEALGYRIDAAVAEAVESGAAAEAASLAAIPPSPFGDPSPTPAAVPSVATCSRCRRDVPARDISFTDGGPICEACVGELAAQSRE